MVMVQCHQVSGRLSDLQFNSCKHVFRPLTEIALHELFYLLFVAAWLALGKTLRRFKQSKIESIKVVLFQCVLFKLVSAETPLC